MRSNNPQVSVMFVGAHHTSKLCEYLCWSVTGFVGFLNNLSDFNFFSPQTSTTTTYVQFGEKAKDRARGAWEREREREKTKTDINTRGNDVAGTRVQLVWNNIFRKGKKKKQDGIITVNTYNGARARAWKAHVPT